MYNCLYINLMTLSHIFAHKSLSLSESIFCKIAYKIFLLGTIIMIMAVEYRIEIDLMIIFVVPLYQLIWLAVVELSSCLTSGRDLKVFHMEPPSSCCGCCCGGWLNFFLPIGGGLLLWLICLSEGNGGPATFLFLGGIGAPSFLFEDWEWWGWGGGGRARNCCCCCCCCCCFTWPPFLLCSIFFLQKSAVPLSWRPFEAE